jgi:hypothetical protein
MCHLRGAGIAGHFQSSIRNLQLDFAIANSISQIPRSMLKLKIEDCR